MTPPPHPSHSITPPGAIGILIVEMLLFIRRATQMEQAYEKKPTLNAEAIAQMRSGGLLTALPPG